MRHVDPYVYPGTHVLKNKFGIKNDLVLEKTEEGLTGVRSWELSKKNIPTPHNYETLKKIHHHLFQDVYEWAGQPRTIGMGKMEPLLNGQSVPYPDPNVISKDNMHVKIESAFDQLAKDNYLKGLTQKEFVPKFCHHMTNIWKARVFRDGNTRTVTEFMKSLSKEANHKIDAEISLEDNQLRDRFVLASVGNSKPLEALVTRSLDKTREGLYEHLKKEDPDAYNKIDSLRKGAMTQAKTKTPDKSIQENLANKVAKKAYQIYSEKGKVPAPATKKAIEKTKTPLPAKI